MKLACSFKFASRFWAC